MAEQRQQNSRKNDVVSIWLKENFSFDPGRTGRFWNNKVPVSTLWQMAKEDLSEFQINFKIFGTIVKRVFPGIKRQHGKGPYSYCGLARKPRNPQFSSISPQDTKLIPIQVADAAVQVAPEQKTIECQVMEESPYCFPKKLFIDLPKDRILERSFLHPIIGGEILGEGSFARVQIMEYKKISVAVKEYKECPTMTLKWLKNRVLNEARTLLNISPHESIPVMFGVVLNSRPYCLVLQLCTRQNQCLTLFKLIKNNIGTIRDLEILDVMAKLYLALHHIHENGFVHNDLKTDNVALIKASSTGIGKRWIPVILDFSESTEIAKKVRRKYNGLHRHIDPDVLLGKSPHSTCSDVFSLGVILKDMCRVLTSKKLRNQLSEIGTQCKGANRPSCLAIAKEIRDCNRILSETF